MDNMVKKRIAIIPARGGSKRIPKKNIIDFFGKPLIAWTIEAAIHSNLFDTILVSTDSEEIAEISKSYGADVPFLRDKYADDFSTVSSATLSALKQLRNFNGQAYEIVTQLMPNCPLRSSKNIIDQQEVFENSTTKNSLLSGFNYGMFNPWWAHIKNDDNTYKKVFSEFSFTKRSQDLEPLICPSGATWISTVNNLKKFNSFYSSPYSFYNFKWHEVVDIDDSNDLILAKAAFKILNGEL